MKPNLKIVKSPTATCEGCFYLVNFECKKEKVNPNVTSHCISNSVVYIETPRHAPTVPKIDGMR